MTQFSRINPPQVLIPVNVNHLGAHNELISTNADPLPYNLMKQVHKPRLSQRLTHYDDPNIARQTPLHPPYESEPTDINNVQGKAMNTFSQPIIF